MPCGAGELPTAGSCAGRYLPVSYTHLDVYKRQASGAAPERSVPGGPAEAVGTGGAPTVVAPKGSAAGGMACAGTQ